MSVTRQVNLLLISPSGRQYTETNRYSVPTNMTPEGMLSRIAERILKDPGLHFSLVGLRLADSDAWYFVNTMDYRGPSDDFDDTDTETIESLPESVRTAAEQCGAQAAIQTRTGSWYPFREGIDYHLNVGEADPDGEAESTEEELV